MSARQGKASRASVMCVQRQMLRAAVEVPSWVPAHLDHYYRSCAVEHGEERAASDCRRLKKQVAR